MLLPLLMSCDVNQNEYNNLNIQDSILLVYLSHSIQQLLHRLQLFSYSFIFKDSPTLKLLISLNL